MQKEQPTLKQSFFKDILGDLMTKSEAIEFVNFMKDYVKSTKEQMTKDLALISKTLTEAQNNVKNSTSNDFNTLKGEVIASLDKTNLNSTTDLDKFKKLLDVKVSLLRDGKDADNEMILKRLVEQIKIPTIEELKNDLPIMGTQVRDSLEILKGEERLDVSAIKGLKEALKKLEKTLGGKIPRFVGGTPRPIFVYAETPVGTVNGTNKAFTINNYPSPATSLVVYADGQRATLTDDYTFSGKTITFVNAPLTNTIIRIDYHM